jgi:hypothetical protein
LSKTEETKQKTKLNEDASQNLKSERKEDKIEEEYDYDGFE